MSIYLKNSYEILQKIYIKKYGAKEVGWNGRE